jgi:hypothetical protein
MATGPARLVAAGARRPHRALLSRWPGLAVPARALPLEELAVLFYLRRDALRRSHEGEGESREEDEDESEETVPPRGRQLQRRVMLAREDLELSLGVRSLQRAHEGLTFLPSLRLEAVQLEPECADSGVRRKDQPAAAQGERQRSEERLADDHALDGRACARIVPVRGLHNAGPPRPWREGATPTS